MKKAKKNSLHLMGGSLLLAVMSRIFFLAKQYIRDWLINSNLP